MVEIKYKGKYDTLEAEGQSIADIRAQYKDEFSLTDKTIAFLNGKKISLASEAGTILEEDDTLVFKKTGIRPMVYIVGALLLTLAITGSIFAYGFTNASTTINAISKNTDYASVSANTSSPVTWLVHGMQKGQTGGGTLFDINTAASGYPGDFTITVSIANLDELIKVYRNLTLKLEVFDAGNNLVDINADGAANANDFTLLTLNNGSVTMPVTQGAPTVYTIKVISGNYIANAGKNSWTSTSGAPMLFCEIAQR